MLFGTLRASLVGNILTGKGVMSTGENAKRVGQDFNATSSFSKFWNTRIMKNDAYVINIDEFRPIGTHWIALHVNVTNKRASYYAIYFERFGVEHITKEIKIFIGNKNIKSNIYRIQTCNWIMYWYFCIRFTDFMLKVKVC